MVTEGPTRTTDWLLRTASVVVILGALKLATPLVVPLLLSAFLAMVSAPLMFWLVRRGVNRYAAVAIAMSAVVAFFGAMLGLAASGMNALVSGIPRYQVRVGELTQEASRWLSANGLPELGEIPQTALISHQGYAVAGSAIAEVATALSSLALVLFIVALLLVELLGIESKLQFVFRHPEIGIEQFRRAALHVQRYIVVKTAANLFTGLLVGLWLMAFRVDFALLWGVCAFMLNYIPTIGSAIVGLPILVVTLLQYGFATTFVVATGYILINAAIAALVEPRVFGHALGLSPLVVFLSMVCWGWLWGPVGAVLSVPLTVVVKISLAYVEGYGWLSRMLSPVAAAQGVGTPSIPPGVLTALSASAAVAPAAVARPPVEERSSSSSALPPVMLPSSGQVPAGPISAQAAPLTALSGVEIQTRVPDAEGSEA